MANDLAMVQDVSFLAPTAEKPVRPQKNSVRFVVMEEVAMGHNLL